MSSAHAKLPLCPPHTPNSRYVLCLTQHPTAKWAPNTNSPYTEDGTKQQQKLSDTMSNSRENTKQWTNFTYAQQCLRSGRQISTAQVLSLIVDGKHIEFNLMVECFVRNCLFDQDRNAALRFCTCRFQTILQSVLTDQKDGSSRGLPSMILVKI